MQKNVGKDCTFNKDPFHVGMELWSQQSREVSKGQGGFLKRVWNSLTHLIFVRFDWWRHTSRHPRLQSLRLDGTIQPCYHVWLFCKDRRDSKGWSRYWFYQKLKIKSLYLNSHKYNPCFGFVLNTSCLSKLDSNLYDGWDVWSWLFDCGLAEVCFIFCFFRC